MKILVASGSCELLLFGAAVVPFPHIVCIRIAGVGWLARWSGNPSALYADSVAFSSEACLPGVDWFFAGLLSTGAPPAYF